MSMDMVITDTRFNRQSGLVDSAILDNQICLIGAGGIGSFTALALAKMGFNRVRVWDYDMVEEHNLPNQFYPLEAIGSAKTEALRKMIAGFTGVDIEVCGSYPDNNRVSGVVISAVDSMDMRKVIYDSVKRDTSIKAFIDGRMGGNQLEVYTVRADVVQDKKAYVKKLWSDEEATQLPCTQRATMYLVLNIASWITNQVRLVLSDKPYYRSIVMDLENMLLLQHND
jgi:hypothetical protein